MQFHGWALPNRGALMPTREQARTAGETVRAARERTRGRLVIDYVPGDWLVESKSLKMYLTSFRNHGAFHEDCTVAIGKRLADLLQPKWLRIGGYWYPRGGIPIDVFWQTGAPIEGVWLPDQGVATYRGRG